ncbi:HTH domain-containing protein [Mycoplasmatota bacterium zrk1]
MESRIIENALELLIMFILERKEFTKKELTEYYKVTEKTIRNNINRINNILADRYIYLQIEYDYSKKVYTIKDIKKK